MIPGKRASPATISQRAIGIALAGLVVTILVLGLASLGAPTIGSRLLAIRTGSMAPTVPVGALVVSTAVDSSDLVRGDVIAIRLDNGVILTHRIEAVVADGDEPRFRLKGDANPAHDPTLVASDQVIGRVTIVVWGVGFLLALLSMPSGIVALASILGTLLVGGWLLDEFSEFDTEDEPRAAAHHGRPGRPTSIALGLLVVLMIGPGPDRTASALLAGVETVPAVVTADVLDPPTNVRCNGGLVVCSIAFLTKPALTWTATPDPYATGYRILRSTTSGSGYVQIATVSGRTTTTFTDTTVSALTTYYYVVRSAGTVWVSTNSAQVTVTVLI